MGDKLEPLASEMYRDLQNTNRFLRWLLLGMLGVIAVLVIALAATNIYHIHQWSQFDTVVVDSGEGSGNANYVQGDNTGGIYNGEGYGPAQEEGQVQGDQG